MRWLRRVSSEVSTVLSAGIVLEMVPLVGQARTIKRFCKALERKGSIQKRLMPLLKNAEDRLCILQRNAGEEAQRVFQNAVQEARAGVGENEIDRRQKRPRACLLYTSNKRAGSMPPIINDERIRSHIPAKAG